MSRTKTEIKILGLDRYNDLGCIDAAGGVLDRPFGSEFLPPHKQLFILIQRYFFLISICWF